MFSIFTCKFGYIKRSRFYTDNAPSCFMWVVTPLPLLSIPILQWFLIRDINWSFRFVCLQGSVPLVSIVRMPLKVI